MPAGNLAGVQGDGRDLAIADTNLDAATDECRAGESCIDMRCVSTPDARGTDAGPPPAFDSGPRPDTGPGPRCGDGVLRAGEACDDGDVDPGDGCDASCAIEDGWACPMPGSPCVATASRESAFDPQAGTADDDPGSRVTYCFERQLVRS